MSMTGFGRGEVTEGSRKVTVELKSVNHRYLDVSIKMPKKRNFFDAFIRNLLKHDARINVREHNISYSPPPVVPERSC